MGKDQELLEAARTGNLQAVKTILSGKLPRNPGSGSGGLTGGLRSLLALKPVNINCSDTSGETPLHLAALNGHREVVLALLVAKAAVTEVDSKGCTPLHLAAWNGHCHICELLLQYAADKSIVNVQTNEGETPLHFAAQHGHLDVVSLLLQSKADPAYRTLAERSALDLAAQYGKTSVVRTLVTGRQELLTHVAGQPSPLHLAAFNGHLPIVSFLLDSGFPVNTRTDNGTALHEAATSCKLDVIKLLLDRGVDVWAKAKNNMTAEDILKSIHSKLTKEALQIISGHVNSQRTPDSDGERDINGLPGPGSAGSDTTPPGFRRPVPKPRSMYGDTLEKGQYRKVDSSHPASSLDPQSPPPPLPPRISLRQVDMPSRDSTPVTDTGQSHLTAEQEQRASRSRDASPMTANREQPKKPPRKTPSMRKTESNQSTTDSTSGSEAVGTPYEKPLPPPPCDTDPTRMDYVNVDLDKVAPDLSTDDSLASAESPVMRQSRGSEGPQKAGDGAMEMGPEDVFAAEAGLEGGDAMTTSTKRESIYANVTMIAEEEAKIAKPKSLEFDKKRESSGDGSNAPKSPTSYAQPPTPDCPPPSPSTAMQGIQQKINPQDKRKSKDMETITESTLLQGTTGADGKASEKGRGDTTGDTSASSAPTAPDQGPAPPPRQGEQSESQDSKPAEKNDPESTSTTAPTTTIANTTTSTGNNGGSSVMTMSDAGVQGGTTVEVEGEKVEMRRSVSSGDNPIDWDSNVFAGLLRGSTPGGPRNVVSQICENVVVKTVRSKRRSTPSTLVTFDPLMEGEEDRHAFDADRVLDEIDSLTTVQGQGGGAGDKDGGAANSKASQQRQGFKGSRGDSNQSRKSDDIFDDSEEWAKIADIVSSYGGRISSSGDCFHGDISQEFDSQLDKLLTDRGRQKIQSVGEWLDSLGLGQYENTLVANGFDDTDFLGGKIIEDQDLTTIGISNESHRTAIVTAAHKLPPPQPIDPRVPPVSVEKWLESLGLSQYLDTFVSHKYNTMQRVVKLWELELCTVLDISSLGHRKRILASLGDRPTERDTSLSPARIRRRDSNEDEPRSPFDNIDLYRDYTSVRPQGSDSGDTRSPSQSPLLAFDKGTENGPASPQGIRDSQIHIRPPHLMHTTGSIKQWRHRPEVLIKGCCNYTAHYLGSTVVKELKGAISTQEGIAKLKQRLRRKLQKSTEVINKIPTIMLSISYKGVKFIDAKSKKVICDHEIANIFCACQDGDHLNFFAYVTKDKETSRHYCHVFSVRSREQAGEIILTLGEAFEIAYQMALKERAEEDAVQFERQLSHSDQDDATSESSKASVNTV